MRIEKKLGYIPSGTTNDFATSLNIPTNIQQAVKRIVKGQSTQIDFGVMNDKYFVYSATFGIFTDIAYKTSQTTKNTLGHLAYMFEEAKSVANIPNFKLRIEYGDNVIEDDFVFGAICNSTSIDGLIKIDQKNVKIDDGKFEILLVKNPFNRLKLRNVIIGLTKNQYDPEYVEFFSVPQISISSTEGISWCLDGEYGGCHKSVEITNHSKSIDCICQSVLTLK